MNTIPERPYVMMLPYYTEADMKADTNTKKKLHNHMYSENYIYIERYTEANITFRTRT